MLLLQKYLRRLLLSSQYYFEEGHAADAAILVPSKVCSVLWNVAWSVYQMIISGKGSAFLRHDQNPRTQVPERCDRVQPRIRQEVWYISWRSCSGKTQLNRYQFKNLLSIRWIQHSRDRDQNDLRSMILPPKVASALLWISLNSKARLVWPITSAFEVSHVHGSPSTRKRHPDRRLHFTVHWFWLSWNHFLQFSAVPKIVTREPKNAKHRQRRVADSKSKCACEEGTVFRTLILRFSALQICRVN